MLEPIAGTASGITGKVSFDPANPGATTGKIVVATKSLVVPNSMMNEHLLGNNWLNAPANPEITFELTTLEGAKTAKNVTSATATGKFTLKGVTKEIKVPVTLTYLADSFGKPVAELVDGLSKLDKIEFQSAEDAQAEPAAVVAGAVAKTCTTWVYTSNRRGWASSRASKRISTSFRY